MERPNLLYVTGRGLAADAAYHLAVDTAVERGARLTILHARRDEGGRGDDPLALTRLEAGAEDVAEYDDGSFDVLCAPDDYAAVKQALAAGEFEAAESDVTMRPATTVELSEEDAESCLKLLDALEDLDDVQNVYSNAEFPEALLAAG